MGSSFSSNELADEDGVFTDENSGNMMLSSAICLDATNINSNMTASAPASQDTIQEYKMPAVPSEGLGNPNDEFAAFYQNAASPHTPNKTPSIDEMSGDGEMIEVEPFNRPEDTHSEPGPVYSNGYGQTGNQNNMTLSPYQTMNTGYLNTNAGLQPYTNSYADPGNQNSVSDLLDLDKYKESRKQNSMESNSSPQTMNANTGHSCHLCHQYHQYHPYHPHYPHHPHINSYAGLVNPTPEPGSFISNGYGEPGNQTNIVFNPQQIMNTGNFNRNTGHPSYTNSSASLANPITASDEQNNYSEEAIKRDQPTRQRQKKNPPEAKMNKKSGSRKSTDVKTILDACEEAIKNCEPKKISPSERRARGTLTPAQRKQNRIDINKRSRKREEEYLPKLKNLKEELKAKLNHTLQKYNDKVKISRNLKGNDRLRSADIFIRDDPIPTNPMTNDFNEDSRGNNKLLDVHDADQQNGELTRNNIENQDEAAGTSATNSGGKKGRRRWSGDDKQRRRQSNKQAQQNQRDKKKQAIEDLKNEIREIWKEIDYYTNLVESPEDLYDEKDAIMHPTTSQMDRQNVDALQGVHDPW